MSGAGSARGVQVASLPPGERFPRLEMMCRQLRIRNVPSGGGIGRTAAQEVELKAERGSLEAGRVLQFLGQSSVLLPAASPGTFGVPSSPSVGSHQGGHTIHQTSVLAAFKPKFKHFGEEGDQLSR